MQQIPERLYALRDVLAKDAARYEKAKALQAALWQGQKTPVQPVLFYSSAHSDREGLASYNYKEEYDDTLCQITNAFPGMLSSWRGGRQAVPSLRANRGCGIVATFLGVTQTVFEDKMPWVLSHQSKKALSKMDAGALKPSDDFCRGLAMMAQMADFFAGTGVMLYPMDTQGPYDIAHIAFGDEIFYEMYDDAPFVHHLMELSLAAIILANELCFEAMPDKDYCAHYNDVVMPRALGGIKVSEDTSTLLSAEQIEQFALPYTARLLAHFGGGYIHYCGKNDHLFEQILHLKDCRGLNFGNAEKHDMEDVLARLAAVGKVYYGGIARRPDEDDMHYFTRLLQAAHKDGVLYLLLRKGVAPDALAQTGALFDKAAHLVRGAG